ncbi:MAG: DedA family protein [Chloroflexi bacterium]|nr:DedA family protein [Chloroflexota bacterium]
MVNFPFHHITPAAQAIFELLREHDLLALSVLIFIEEVGVPLPLPGNLLLAVLGMQSSRNGPNIVQLVIVMTFASVAGSVTLYTLGARLGHPALMRWGRFIGLDQRRVLWIESWLRRHGSPVVFVGRIIPGLRTPTSAVSGIFDVALPVFVAMTGAASFLWTLFWVILGRILGRTLHLDRFLSSNHLGLTVALALVLLLVVPLLGVLVSWWQRRRQGTEGSPPVDVESDPLSTTPREPFPADAEHLVPRRTTNRS